MTIVHVPAALVVPDPDVPLVLPQVPPVIDEVAPVESTILVVTVSPAADVVRPLPPPVSFNTVTVNVCDADAPTSFVADCGVTEMFASTQVLVASSVPPGPCPTDAVVESLSLFTTKPLGNETATEANACTVPVVGPSMMIVHVPPGPVVPVPEVPLVLPQVPPVICEVAPFESTIVVDTVAPDTGVIRPAPPPVS